MMNHCKSLFHEVQSCEMKYPREFEHRVFVMYFFLKCAYYIFKSSNYLDTTQCKKVSGSINFTRLDFMEQWINYIWLKS